MQKNNLHYTLHTTAKPYLDLVRSHTDPYTTIVHDQEIIIFPGVMSPKYDWSSHFAIEHLPDVNQKNILDLGCGCGILSLFAALGGAHQVIGLDINGVAVANTNENFKKHSFDNNNFKALESNVFSALTKEKFDVVLFNAPFHGTAASDMLERGVSDENYTLMKEFWNNVGDILTPTGTICLVFSDTGDMNLVHDLSARAGYKEKIRFSHTEDGWTCYVIHYVLG